MSKNNGLNSGITIDEKDIKVRVNFNRQKKRLSRAQYRLDEQIMEDMTPLMPFDQGAFIQLTQARSKAIAGSGQVCAGVAPMGRYLYEGKVMVDSETGKGARPMDIDGQIIFRHRKYAILKVTDRPLTYSKTTNPEAGDHWYERAKKMHLKEWIQLAQEVVDGKQS